MVSGTAIWGSVAPRLQVFDFPVPVARLGSRARVVDGAVGREAADYLERTVRMRPLAWGDSFGFRQVMTRIARHHRAEPAGRAQAAHHPVADLRESGGADGREPDADGLRRGLHLAADRRHRRLRARREHDAAAAVLRGRPPHGADRHIAGVLGLFASTVGLARLPAGVRAALERRRSRRRTTQRAMGPQEDAAAMAAARQRGMTIRDIDAASSVSRPSGCGARGARARCRGVARGDSRVTSWRTAPPLRARRRRSRAAVGDRRPGRRAGGSRRPAGRRPSRGAPAVSRGRRRSPDSCWCG